MRRECAWMLIMLAVLPVPSSFAAEVSISAPDRVSIGAAVMVDVTGESARGDFLTIVALAAAEGSYERYAYARESQVELKAPQEPGTYEIRYLGAARPYPTLARHTLTVEAVEATLEAPASIAAGAPLEFSWEGPGHPLDFFTIVPADAPEGSYDQFVYAKDGSPLTLTAPDDPGAYELRYLLGDVPYASIGRLAIQVTGTTAALEFASTAVAGAPVSINWSGPGNELDFLTLVEPDAAAGTWDEYVYTRSGNPVTLPAPETPGTYEIRYLTGQSYATLAAEPITVTPASASITGPETAPARTIIEVSWEGPGNDRDYLAIHRPDADNYANAPYAMVRRGSVLRIETPGDAGTFEVRYITGQERRTLATRELTVTPRAVPSRLRVVASGTTTEPGAKRVVAVVLDASGSMLQRLNGTRRIELARDAVAALINEGLPPDAAFGLWVFGHREPDTCRTDLEIPIGPLDPTTAVATVRAVEAKNLAKTPIAASLGQVATALAGRAGDHLVILVTDGEETCDGDPAAVIEAMRGQGLDVRVNIVGFAIDELMLRETFTEWARLGGGRYFDAGDADALARSLEQAVDPTYDVIDSTGGIVASGTVNGDALEIMPGNYLIRLADGTEHPEQVVVAANELELVELR